MKSNCSNPSKLVNMEGEVLSDICCLSNLDNSLLSVPGSSLEDNETLKPGDNTVEKELKRYRYEDPFILACQLNIFVDLFKTVKLTNI